MAFLGNDIPSHVLLVDHDTDAHASMVDMLNYFSYQVTSVKLASTALSMLSEGKATFDIVIVNINSPDLCGFTLLQEAVKLDLFVMLLLDKEDVGATTKGLDEGAFLCVSKPITIETVRYLWQYVLREKISKLKAAKRGHGVPMAVYGNGFGEGNPSGVHMTFEDDLGKHNSHGNTGGQRSTRNQDEDGETEDDPNVGSMKKKVWTEWTEELHEKFVEAITQLGEGRCYPKEILELMNVPGLTRMQVASHLQKCRGGTWPSPNDGKYTESPESSPPSDRRAPRTKSRRFGSMPILDLNPQNIQENQEKISSATDHEELNVVNSPHGDNSSNSSDAAQGYRPQIQPQDIANGNYNMNAYHGHVQNNGGAINMWNLELSLGMDDPHMSGQRFPSHGDQVAVGHGSVGFNSSTPHHMNVANEDTFEFQSRDFMVQNPSAVQQDQVGITNYNGTSYALDLEQLYSMQIPAFVPHDHAKNGQWIHDEEPGSADYYVKENQH